MAAALGLALFRDRGMTKPCFGKGLKFTEGWLRRSGMKLQGAPNRCKQGLKIQILQAMELTRLSLKPIRPIPSQTPKCLRPKASQQLVVSMFFVSSSWVVQALRAGRTCASQGFER